MKPFTEEQFKLYILKQGECCPYCGYTHPEFDRPYDLPWTQVGHCLVCDKWWEETYTLTALNEIEEADILTREDLEHVDA